MNHRISTGTRGLDRFEDLRRQRHDVLSDRTNRAGPTPRSCFDKAAHELLWIARQPDKLDVAAQDERCKHLGRYKSYAIPGLQQPLAKRDEGLNVSTRSIGQQCNVHQCPRTKPRATPRSAAH